MIHTESTAPIPVSTSGYSAVAIAPDTAFRPFDGLRVVTSNVEGRQAQGGPSQSGADFEVRWAAWRTRGVAHERAVRRTLVLVGSLAGILATAVAIAYTLLRP